MSNSRKGFALIEALLSVVLLAVVFSVLMQSLLGSGSAVHAVGDYGRAWLLASEKLQQKRILDRSNINSEERADGLPQTVRVDFKPITSPPEMAGLKQMDVVVSWDKDRSHRQWQLRTLLSDDQTVQTSQSIFYR